MKRRNFLKLLGIAPLAPSVLAVKVSEEEKLVEIMEGIEFSNHPVLPDEIVVYDPVTSTLTIEDSDTLSFGGESDCLIMWDTTNLIIKSET